MDGETVDNIPSGSPRIVVPMEVRSADCKSYRVSFDVWAIATTQKKTKHTAEYAHVGGGRLEFRSMARV